MKSNWSIPTAIVIGGIIIAYAIYASVPRTDPSHGSPSLVRLVSPDDHILGNPTAKVTIIEYSDFDCEFCKGFHDTLHQIVATEGAQGDVAWVFREFPLTEIHTNAFSHARAAECAASVGGNDAFWKFADVLFKNQPVDPSQYGTLAAKAGFTGTAFADCVATASSTIDARINADRQNALDMGATGTPYSVILVAGKAPIVVDGAYSYEDLKLTLDQALSN